MDERYTEFGQRVQIAKRHAGIRSDAELAARVSALLPEDRQIDQRAMQRLKSVDRSEYTPYVAEVCGVRAVWLADGSGEMLPERDLPQDQQRVIETYARLPTAWQRVIRATIELAGGAEESGLSPVRKLRPAPRALAASAKQRPKKKGRR